MSAQKQITKVFLTNKISSTLIIPIRMARKYNLDKPVYVTIEESPDGILIRKLEVQGLR
jgi:hypothetical protein